MFNETVYGEGGLRPRRRYGAGLSDSVITEGGRRYRLWEKDGITYRTDIGPVPVEVSQPLPVVQATQVEHQHHHHRGRPRRYAMPRYQERPRFVPQPRRPHRGRRYLRPAAWSQAQPVDVKPVRDIRPMPPIRVVPKPEGYLGPPMIQCPAGTYAYNGKCIPYPAIRGPQKTAPPIAYTPKITGVSSSPLYGLGDLADLSGCGCESGGSSSGFDSIPNWVLIGGVVFAAAMVLKKR